MKKTKETKDERTNLSPEQQELETNEYSLRPTCLKDFIGQEAAKENLKVFIESAKKRKIANVR